METPPDIDAMLKGIIEEEKKNMPRLPDEDEQDIADIMNRVRNGQKGFFMSVDEHTDSFQLKFIFPNQTRKEALNSLTRVFNRLIEGLPE